MTDLPCRKVTSLQCQISVACTCLENSWLLQSPLLKGKGRVAPSQFLSGAVIACHHLADSNRAFERLQGTGIGTCTVRPPNHEVSPVTTKGQGSHSGYLFCCVEKMSVWLFFLFVPPTPPPPRIPRNCSSAVNAFPISLTCMYELALYKLDQLLTAWGRNFVMPGD